MNRRSLSAFAGLGGFAVLAVVVPTPFVVAQEAAEEPPPAQVLFENVRVFDGTSDRLSSPTSVLVENNLIKSISPSAGAGPEAVRIDGGGRTLMPGLHDMHTHIAIHRPVAGDLRLDTDPFHMGAIAAARVQGMLMNGFTTIRDIGGPAKFMQRTVDAGLVPGPRIYPSEAFITQTSGHGDFRNRNDIHPNSVGGSRHFVDQYFGAIADGEAEVIRATRESLRLGATQIKIMGSGGVASEWDPLHTVQYQPEEIRAAVRTAAQWKTYVASHCFTDDAVRQAIENGVKVIEHAPLMSEESAKLMAANGVWLVPSLAATMNLDFDEFRKISSEATYNKAVQVAEGNPAAIGYAVKHNVKMAYGTDLLSDWETSVEYDKQANLEFRFWAQYVSNAEALRLATSKAAELNRLTGPNNPYQEGPLGVVEVGAYADLLLVDGNPLEDIELMVDAAKNFKIIMKDGVIYKNTLE